MKKIILILSVVLSFNLTAATVMVSDLDDTIKITNSGDPAEAARRAVLSDDVFIGMPEFLKAASAYVDEVHVLSASPTLLKPKIEATFKRRGIEVNSIILKNPLARQSTLEYKVAAVKKLMEKNSGDDFILVGDDVDKDPEVYAEIHKQFPNRVLGIYIHAIRNREVAAPAVKYWTAYDLFLREYQAKRMAHFEVAQAGNQLLGEARMNLIFPDFADCPQDPNVWFWQMSTVFAIDAGALMGKSVLYCKARQSTIL